MPITLHELEQRAIENTIKNCPSIEKIMADIDRRLEHRYSMSRNSYDVWEGHIPSKMVVDEIVEVLEDRYKDFEIRTDSSKHNYLEIKFQVRNESLKEERKKLKEGPPLLELISRRSKQEEANKKQQEEKERVAKEEKMGSPETRLILEAHALRNGMRIEWHDDSSYHIATVYWVGWGKARTMISVATREALDDAIKQNRQSIFFFQRYISWIFMYLFLVDAARNKDINRLQLPSIERAKEVEVYQRQNMSEVDAALAFPLGSEQDGG